MSGALSSGAKWSTRLEPVRPPEDTARRADDPRLGEIIECWRGNRDALKPGRAVLLGFAQDEGVRRNHGRPGAAEAPREIRRQLGRLTPWDGANAVDLSANPPLDLGNVRVSENLEDSQHALAEVIGAILQMGAVPVVLGGGHETAYGHYLGYVMSNKKVGIVNLDAHLDVRAWTNGLGHSGSPFRQAMEHSEQPLPGNRYVCLGAQPHAVSRQHLNFARQKGCRVRWCSDVEGTLAKHLVQEHERLAPECQVYVTLDADVVRAADVSGVSAPNPVGLSGREVAACIRVAGQSPNVRSFDLVEINPRFDPDGRSARWAALVVWNFLVGLSLRVAPANDPN